VCRENENRRETDDDNGREPDSKSNINYIGGPGGPATRVANCHRKVPKERGKGERDKIYDAFFKALFVLNDRYDENLQQRNGNPHAHTLTHTQL